MQPLVSIVTPTLNSADSLQKTFDSIRSQTYPNIEHIIIDGGSTDDTLEIIDRNKEYVSFWISEKDKGIADAFNKGIAVCKGEIIGILNSDDTYELEAVQKVVNLYLEYNPDVIYSQIRRIKGDETVEENLHPNHHLLGFGMHLYHPGVFISKSAYNKFGRYSTDYKIAMDYELLLRMFYNKARFEFLPFITTNFSILGKSNKHFVKGQLEVLKIKNKYSSRKIEKFYNSIIFVDSVIKGSNN